MISEITQVSEKDSYILNERRKKMHTYPLHRHEEYELNFVENCKGNRRIVGDSIEYTDSYDLVLMGGGLEHTWEQGDCESGDIHEITIHFSRDLFSDSFLYKTTMEPMRKLLEKASMGVAFPMKTIMHVYNIINDLSKMEPGFYSVMKFFELIYELSVSDDYRVLSSGAFSHAEIAVDSRRVHKVKAFVDKNFKEEIRLQDLANMVCMTPTALSRFFKLRAGKTISDYIIDVRLGHAARLLADSTMTVVEICYHCGFNNISNFNRVFRKRKGCTPTEFRANYHKKSIIV